LKVGLAIIFIITLVAYSDPARSQEKLEKMNVGYSAQAGAFAPIWITKETGLFKKNGLD
jgi:ABC-type nitrate/sulfonate/bicarbonate transport system substrate-binding protein